MQAACVCVFLALAVFAVFGQTAHFGFVDYDDPANVSANSVVQQGLSLKAVGWAFTHSQGANWIPLTTLSHILDCQLFGPNAGGHHIVNVLFHAATAVLLFLVLRQMTGSMWRSAFVAAVFAVHPLRAESVAWISERKDVLSGFFFVLAVGAYARWTRKPSRARYAAVCLLFALGLLAKSMVATLPFVLLLLDYWPLGRMRGIQNSELRIKNSEGGERKTHGLTFGELVKEKIPLFLLSVASCVAASLMPGLLIKDARQLPMLERIGNAVVSYAVYLWQMVVPAGLAAPYPNPPGGQPAWKVCLAFVLLAAITAGVIMWRKKRPCLLMGWLWYLGMLFPVIGIIQISPDAAHADRYTYLPEIGLAVAATWAVADWSAGWMRRRLVLGGLMTAVAGVLAVLGHIQTSYWKDSESLWTRALDCTSGNNIAHYNLGNIFAAKGANKAAIVEYQEALDIQPNFSWYHYNLGIVLFKEGKVDEAIAEYRKASELAPDDVRVLNNLGTALVKKGSDEAAIGEYRTALKIQPDYPTAHYNLANVLVKDGRLDEAIAEYRRTLDLAPDQLEVFDDLGNALAMKGDVDGAMACYEKNAVLTPTPVARWNRLGNGFLQVENWKAAIACYRRTLKFNPRSPDVCASLATALVKNGEFKEAIGCLQQSLDVNPDQIPVLNNLALLLATSPDSSLRDGAKAVALATKASQLSGSSNPAILYTLAEAYAEQGSYAQAAATARHALELAVGQKQDALAAKLQEQIRLYEANPHPQEAPGGVGDLK